MATIRSAERPALDAADTQLARVASDGCARHPHLQALVEAGGRDAGRDLSDAVHLLCGLHGHHPGLIEIALQRCPSGPSQSWLARASEAFERERLYLVRLIAAVGPLPSTPGAGETEVSLQGARRALETLAQSERQGCALGSATALVSDWWPIRRVLDCAAVRAGVPAPAPSLPDETSVIGVIGGLLINPATARALAFGSEQLLLQHRALFDLLEARAEARSTY